MSSGPTTRAGSVPGSDPGLTPRQKAVLELLLKGRTNRQIAAALTVSEKTAENYASAVIPGPGCWPGCWSRPETGRPKRR